MLNTFHKLSNLIFIIPVLHDHFLHREAESQRLGDLSTKEHWAKLNLRSVLLAASGVPLSSLTAKPFLRPGGPGDRVLLLTPEPSWFFCMSIRIQMLSAWLLPNTLACLGLRCKMRLLGGPPVCPSLESLFCILCILTAYSSCLIGAITGSPKPQIF